MNKGCYIKYIDSILDKSISVKYNIKTAIDASLIQSNLMASYEILFASLVSQIGCHNRFGNFIFTTSSYFYRIMEVPRTYNENV